MLLWEWRGLIPPEPLKIDFRKLTNNQDSGQASAPPSNADTRRFSRHKNTGRRYWVDKLKSLAIPHLRASNDWTLIHSRDWVTRAISIGSSTGASLQSCLTRFGLKVNTSGNISTAGWRNKVRRQWYSQQVYGLGAAAFHDDTISNTWLRNLELARIRHTLAALQLRSNTYLVRAALTRERPQADATCRH